MSKIEAAPKKSGYPTDGKPKAFPKVKKQTVFPTGDDFWKQVPGEYTTRRSSTTSRGREKEQKTAPIEFSLFAPYIEKAAVRGDFSEWKDIEMSKGEDGYFRATLDLADGDYEYKFCLKSNSPWQLGEMICVSDPMATDINEDNMDNSIVHVRNGQIIVDEYEWKNDQAWLAPDNELVIYELHIGDFGGTFQDVIDKLDYLSSLGVNAIEFLPVTEFPGKYSWGYNPRHFFAVESAYGTTVDFKRLVDECHARSIRVILDLVANHAHEESPLVHIDHNYWFQEHNTDEYQFGPKFDYNHCDENMNMFPARKFMNEVAFYWSTEFHLDGIRFDATALINNFDFLHWIGEAVKRSCGMKPFYLVAEHLPVDPAVVGLEGPMDGLWHDYFYWQMTANLRESEFQGWQAYDWEKTMDVIQPSRIGIFGASGAVQYLSNHDHSRVMHELGTVPILDEKAFRKLKLGFGVLLTSVGVPMIWMGDEFGQATEKTIDPNPLDWDLLKNDRNSDLYHYVSGLIYMRKSTGALKTENLEFIHLDTEKGILAWKRWDDGGSQLIAVANFSDSYYADYAIPGIEDGDWHEFTFDYDTHVEGGNLVDSVAESSCKIYIKK